MRDIIISTTVCVACLLLALVSQIVAPSTVAAAPAQPAAVRSEASKPQQLVSFELDPDDPNPTLFAMANDSARADASALGGPLDRFGSPGAACCRSQRGFETPEGVELRTRP